MTMLHQRIDELEEEKRQSALEDERQNTQTEELKEKLSKQEARFEEMTKKLQSFLPGKTKIQPNSKN